MMTILRYMGETASAKIGPEASSTSASATARNAAAVMSPSARMRRSALTVAIPGRYGRATGLQKHQPRRDRASRSREKLVEPVPRSKLRWRMGQSTTMQADRDE